MHNIEKFKKLTKDYLTFYHELRIPQHDFFINSENCDEKTRLLVISSPSRMGNHLILSMLDNHPEIPRIPGEDGFHSFSFFQANYDIHNYLEKVRINKSIEYIIQVSTNHRGDKWKVFKDSFDKNEIPEKYSGITSGENLAIVDFEGTLFPINDEKYFSVLKDGLSIMKEDRFYRDYLNLYYESLMHLDFDYKKDQSSYDRIIVFSGMRTQCSWLLKFYKNVKIIVSIRPFESYVYSHIRSRYGKNVITNALIQEAWEHWYHKVIDYFFLKLKYPQNVCLISFDNLVLNSERSAKAIAKFIDLKYHTNMLKATVFGIPVKGNSSISKSESDRGSYYMDKYHLGKHLFPSDYHNLWSAFQIIETI